MNTACAAATAELLQEAERLLEARELAAALDAYDRAEKGGTDADRCDAGRWMAHALQGNLARAWQVSDRIRARGTPDVQRFWQGERFAGKRVIVRCLHGLGDSIQYLRFLPALLEQASSVTVEVPPALLGLAPMLQGMDRCELITWGEAAPAQPPAWDVQMEVAELPYVFRAELGEGLPVAPYLRNGTPRTRDAGHSLCTCRSLCACHSARREESALLSQTSRLTMTGLPNCSGKKPKLRVGLVWAASEWDATRSLPWRLAQDLVRNQQCEFWNLQGGAARADWQKLPEELLHATHQIGGGLETLANAIAGLDLLISVDTLAAHLAGAMHVPCWLMLQYAADWRWMVQREDSPWYPSLRLFRQQAPGDWTGVVHSVASQLAPVSSEAGR